LNPVGSGQGPVVGSCEYGDEPSGSGATELVHHHTFENRDEITSKFRYLFSFILPIDHATVSCTIRCTEHESTVNVTEAAFTRCEFALASEVPGMCPQTGCKFHESSTVWTLKKVTISFIVLA
jgi:hypothetical protein